jgi:branched-subunit amino acid ABC-type transport system permease component
MTISRRTRWKKWLFLITLLGRAFRAAADDPETMQLMGVNNRHIHAMAMAIAIVAVAGVFLALQTTVSPTDGPEHLLYAFEAVIIGGLGSLWGTLVKTTRATGASLAGAAPAFRGLLTGGHDQFSLEDAAFLAFH